MFRLGIDIGGTKINIGLIDENRQIVVKHTQNVPDNKDYKNVIHTVKAVLDSNAILKKDVISCGIGVPGTVSADGRVAVKVPNLGWENAEIAEEFERATGIPATLIQDSRAAAYGEYKAGAGQGRHTVVCVTLGTGIGTGIVINGEIFNGALGGAGELGHVTVVENGRECGCGKRGCLEKYAAGMGLGITAKEMFGQDCTANDIFKYAEEGDEASARILECAAQMIGNAMVSMANLLSPDCLLFSGGMSRRTAFVDSITKYIKEHSYSTTAEGMHIGLSALGEDSPMIGAALFSKMSKTRQAKLSASVMCADLLKLGDELKTLENAGMDYIHFDVMDGHFVPNLMLSPEMIKTIRKGTDLPLDIHLMVEKPENVIPLMELKSGDIVSLHWESTPNLQRALTMVKETGAFAAVAINPSTPVECIRDVLDEIEVLLIMTVNPGFSGQKITPGAFEKIKRVRQYLDNLGYNHISIAVDGNCSFDNIPKMYIAGAEIFVVGSSSVFSAEYGITEGSKKVHQIINNIKEEF